VLVVVLPTPTVAVRLGACAFVKVLLAVVLVPAVESVRNEAQLLVLQAPPYERSGTCARRRRTL